MRLASAVCMLTLSIPPFAASAMERSEASYVLSWRGVEIGRFETMTETDGAAYRIGYAAETTGFLGWLWPFASAGASEGAIGDPGLVPERHAGESRRRDGSSSWTVRFSEAGAAEEVALDPPRDDADREPVPEPLRRAPDPLTLALEASTAVGPGGRVEGTAFDGKRAVRFELSCGAGERPAPTGLREEGVETVLPCTLDGEMAGGRSRRYGSARDDERQPARILLSPDVATGRYWPVRIEAETRFGPVLVDLTDYR